MSLSSDSSTGLHSYSLWKQMLDGLGKQGVVFMQVYRVLFKYTILLVIIFMIESVIGLLSYVYQEQKETDQKSQLKFKNLYLLDF